jgi:hypothetical protein
MKRKVRMPTTVEMLPHEAILADAEPEMPQLHLYHALMRDYEENPLRMEDDPNEGHSNMDEWFPKDRSNDKD